jgi:hypothetical protein
MAVRTNDLTPCEFLIAGIRCKRPAAAIMGYDEDVIAVCDGHKRDLSRRGWREL